VADGPLRAFIAVPLPGALCDSIARVVAALRGLPGADRVRWLRRENLHVTLRFLGNIDPDITPSLLTRVQEQTARLTPFELSLTRVDLFPSRRRPSVVAFEMAPAEPLSELAQAVERGVVAAGLPREERPFRAHLTLGRIRERNIAFDVTASDTAVADALPVTEAVLFQSQLQRSGALHTPLGRARLGVDGPSVSRFTP
jgi:2'-5' RNA ligase